MTIGKFFLTLFCTLNMYGIGATAESVSTENTNPSVIQQPLDEGAFSIIQLHAGTVGISRFVEVRAFQKTISNNSRTTLGINLLFGLEVYIDGHLFKGHAYDRPGSLHSAVQSTTASGFDSTGLIRLEKETSEIEIRFYGKPIGRYSIHNNQIQSLMKPAKLSRFNMRRFNQPGFTSPIYSNGKVAGGTVLTGPDGNNDLKRWMDKPVFVDSSPSKLSPHVDLHTHLAGAIETKDLIEIAEKLSLPYPVENIERMKLTYDTSAVIESNGKKYVPFSRQNIQFEVYHGGYDYYWSSLYDYFEISPTTTVPFERMSLIYKMRDPIVKNIAAFPLILEKLAQDYARNGVKYAELSFYTIVNPEWRAIANKLIPELEKKYGVSLRFLVGMWRHSDDKINNQVIHETQEAMRASPYIVGVDFMGHETNPTLDFKPAMEELSKFKKEYPNMVLRVHAGENPNHTNNIIDAIKLGATRIGHGIYGVTDEVIRLAKERNVIIEFNFNSNLALQNVDSSKQLATAAKKYLAGGVRVTLGTDGHGLYHTSPMSELAVARELMFSDSDFERIQQSDYAYYKLMETDTKQRLRLNNRLEKRDLEKTQSKNGTSTISLISCERIFN